MNSDHMLEAHFAKLYTLTVVAYEGGTTDPPPGSHQYKEGTTAWVDAIPYTGYRFEYWLINGIRIEWKSIGITMYTNILAEAHFDNHYNLYISSSLWGRTDPYDGTYTYEYGESVTVTAIPWDDCAFDYWVLDGVNVGNANPIAITMDADHELKAYFHDLNPGGGDSCPTLFVWNGTVYVDYGVIDIHNPTGEDIVREVPILKEDVDVSSNYKAKFRLREGWEGLNFSESLIDQVKLYAVDSQGNHYLCPLVKAEHSRLGNVLPQLIASDDYKVQILLLETIDLTFIVPYQNAQGFTFTIEGCNMFKQ